jgi:hypothetical protein
MKRGKRIGGRAVPIGTARFSAVGDCAHKASQVWMVPKQNGSSSFLVRDHLFFRKMILTQSWSNPSKGTDPCAKNLQTQFRPS